MKAIWDRFVIPSIRTFCWYLVSTKANFSSQNGSKLPQCCRRQRNSEQAPTEESSHITRMNMNIVYSGQNPKCKRKQKKLNGWVILNFTQFKTEWLLTK